MKNQLLVGGLRQKASTQKRGKLIVLAGISGSGKSYILNMLRKKYNVASIQKIVTRPFRQTEIDSIREGKNIDIKPVIDLFNDGEKTLKEQSANEENRKKAFLALSLPFSYVNYDNYYGFDLEQINSYLDNGRNVAIIVNDIPYIKDLKTLYGDNCVTALVHRGNEITLDSFLRIAKERGDNHESAMKRYEKAIRDEQALNNKSVFDTVILNTEDNDERLSLILNNELIQSKKKKKIKNNDKEWKPKLYIFIGNPGSGKDEILNMIRVQGILHSVIIPKWTTRKRRTEDGNELICMGDDNYQDKQFWTNLDSNRFISYTNYSNTYAIDCNMIRQRLEDGVPCSLIVSNEQAINSLRQQFPDQVVTIYMSGKSKKEYEKEHIEELRDEYIQKRLDDYYKADELYRNGFFDYIIISGQIDVMKDQLYQIMEIYEKGRPMLSRQYYTAYLNKARQYTNYKENLFLRG